MELSPTLTMGLIGLAIVVPIIFLIIWIISLRVVVPTNMVHIVQTRNSSVDYGRGRETGNSYYRWPSWIPVIGVVVSVFHESIFEIPLTDYEAYDSGRLPFVVDIMAFFRVENAPVAAQRVNSQEQLQRQLTNVVKGAVRSVLAKEPLESTMEDRTGLGAKFTAEVDKGLNEWGVTLVREIEFMDIRDHSASTVIANIMAKEESRIDHESRIAVAENRQQAEVKEVETAQAISIRQQEAEQMVGIRTAEKEREMGIANEQAVQQVLDQKTVTAEKDMAVKKVTEVRAAEIARSVAEVKAGQDKNVQIIEAEAKRDQTTIIADGELNAAKKNAEAIIAEGQAKGAAETSLLMAPVNSQLELSKGLGENERYLTYLVDIRQVEATEAVGKQAAQALSGADLKIIANSGDVVGGVNNLMDIFSSKGGAALGAMATAFAQTPEGQQLVSKLTGGESPAAPKAPRTRAPK